MGRPKWLTVTVIGMWVDYCSREMEKTRLVELCSQVPEEIHSDEGTSTRPCLKELLLTETKESSKVRLKAWTKGLVREEEEARAREGRELGQASKMEVAQAMQEIQETVQLRFPIDCTSWD